MKTLREWVIQESQFDAIAHEIVIGLTKGDWRAVDQGKINKFLSEKGTIASSANARFVAKIIAFGTVGCTRRCMCPTAGN